MSRALERSFPVSRRLTLFWYLADGDNQIRAVLRDGYSVVQERTIDFDDADDARDYFNVGRAVREWYR